VKTRRVEQLNSEFKREISSILADEIKDPRLTAIVSVLNVNVTRDLSYADIHVSMIGTEEQKKESFEAILSSAGYIRRLLGQRMKIRYIPQLRFKYNDYIEEGIRISKLIDEVIKDSKATE
jgi:ribosome-binding factor A